MKEVAILIPAHNEELIIERTLKELTAIFPAEDVYLVDDGSSDLTAEVSGRYITNVLRISNRGKAEALNAGISKFKLTERYRYILFMDADTSPHADFVKHATEVFKADPENKISCVVGRVRGRGNSWIEKYRQWEYQISHSIYKEAQSFYRSILVAPGCATLYRSSAFKNTKFPTGTLTEDMDLTFLLHRKGFSNMVYENRSYVTTQDPQNLRDFIKQIYRWYTGFWQNVRKHDIPWKGQRIDFEAALMALEGLYNGLLVVALIIFLPWVIRYNSLGIFKLPLLVDFFVFFLPTLLWSAWSSRNFNILLYISGFYFLRIVSNLVFLVSFFRAYLIREQRFIWDTRRYSFSGKEAN